MMIITLMVEEVSEEILVIEAVEILLVEDREVKILILEEVKIILPKGMIQANL